jgi:hypothetical protein
VITDPPSKAWSSPDPALLSPIRGVVMTHYDGEGNFTQVDRIVFNGVPPAIEWTPGSGTYHVNANCTGTGCGDMNGGSRIRRSPRPGYLFERSDVQVVRIPTVAVKLEVNCGAPAPSGAARCPR